jgi:hypothetical protein
LKDSYVMAVVGGCDSSRCADLCRVELCSDMAARAKERCSYV